IFSIFGPSWNDGNIANNGCLTSFVSGPFFCKIKILFFCSFPLNNVSDNCNSPIICACFFINACNLSACRSEEHTSELQSRFDLVCRLLLEKKKKKKQNEQTEVRAL